MTLNTARIRNTYTLQSRAHPPTTINIIKDLCDELDAHREFIQEIRSVLALQYKTPAAITRNIEAELRQLDQTNK